MANSKAKSVPKVGVNVPKPASGRIAWHFENGLVRFVLRVFDVISNPIRSLIAFALEEFIDVIEEQAKSKLVPSLNMFINNERMPQEIKNAFKDASSGEHSADLLVWIAGFIALITSLGGAATAPAGRLVTYNAENRTRSHRPSPVDTILMHRLEAFDIDERLRSLRDVGVDDRYVKGYELLLDNLLSENELLSSWLRGDIGEDFLDIQLTKKGLNPQSIYIIKKLTDVIPGPQDLIRMAVREAFNDKVAREFGYDDDFPDEFGIWAKKVGVSEFWSEKFWRAHWELPGVREGFEMLHRRIIDPDQLQLLLRARDIPSFWRAGLTKLSYNPYTRVDVRRMYSLGVVNRDEVFDNYLDLGYSPERAEKLTEWTELEYGESNRDLTKGDVIGAYQDNAISEQEVISLLTDIGYDENEIVLLLTRADLRREAKYEKEFVENVRVSYVGKRIDRADVIGKLNTLNPPSGFVETSLALWDLQRDRQVTLAAKGDIKAFYQSGIIDKDTVFTELRKRNYQDYTIEWYVQLWQVELDG